MTGSSKVAAMAWTRHPAAISLLQVMDEHRKQAGLRVVKLREARGLSQEELAHRAGVSVRTISRLENGRHDGRRGTVRAIAEALSVEERDILGDVLLDGAPHQQLDRIEQKVDALLRHAGLDPEIG